MLICVFCQKIRNDLSFVFCTLQTVFYIKHSIWFKYLLVLMSLAMGIFMGTGLIDLHQNLNWVGMLYVDGVHSTYNMHYILHY